MAVRAKHYLGESRLLSDGGLTQATDFYVPFRSFVTIASLSRWRS
jgi:hypothetical protein